MIIQVIAGALFILLVAGLSYKEWIQKEEVKRKQCCECKKTFYETQKRAMKAGAQEIMEWDACPYCHSHNWIIV